MESKGNTVAQYELGRSNPIDAVLSLICREFNVCKEWLQTGEGEMFNSEPIDVLDQLVKKYNLSNTDYIMIEKFINLNSETRHIVFDYFKSVVAAVTESESQIPEKILVEEMTVEEAEQEYIKSRLKAVQKEKLSVLNTTAGKDNISKKGIV